MQQLFSSPIDVEAAFYDAFRNLDIAGMQQVWADLPTVYCIHPSGQLLIGYESVIQSWSRMFQGVERPHIKTSLSNESQGSEQAVHLINEIIGPGSTSQESFTAVLATNVFVLTEQGWRLFSHHASPSLTGVKPAYSPQMH